ncbi:hypothetical protein TGME49_276820 [Toxoplasma gondii ME49]|uniref:Uncharacterized protein n=2 Tax=Toxoplasma gondii TaxID=5811 RepID=A0A125YMW3_TOXGV|nr:hypothetical protein TGME49_276820 [Toxoplasma gondii ME49]EPT25434.1 hypothetical protein TGME49_276820 [Toxoplasma gondii ME49]ESS34691.1 hypothetical protein TGVEG_276820 [Toxoplasma gondii VEG]|eukprot:XP_018635184.1 hypothetical protein TGME49_276820 [Toxoplasma gondii ME49]
MTFRAIPLLPVLDRDKDAPRQEVEPARRHVSTHPTSAMLFLSMPVQFCPEHTGALCRNQRCHMTIVAGSMMIHSHPPCIDCSDTSGQKSVHKECRRLSVGDVRCRHLLYPDEYYLKFLVPQISEQVDHNQAERSLILLSGCLSRALRRWFLEWRPFSPLDWS